MTREDGDDEDLGHLGVPIRVGSISRRNPGARRAHNLDMIGGMDGNNEDWMIRSVYVYMIKICLCLYDQVGGD